jgi:hypothetical protein
MGASSPFAASEMSVRPFLLRSFEEFIESPLFENVSFLSRGIGFLIG